MHPVVEVGFLEKILRQFPRGVNHMLFIVPNVSSELLQRFGRR